MRSHLFDTNIFSYFLKRNENTVRRMYEFTSEGGIVIISVITHYEMMSGFFKNDSRKRMSAYYEMLGLIDILGINTEIAVRAADIKAELSRKGQVIEDADILIAATALHHDLTLVTHNTRHFERVPALKLEDWTV